jgi:hypothetical protein
MPIKYKEDSETKDRSTGKVTTQRFYIHALSTPSLWEEFEKCRTPKVKVKFRNELVKRGFSNQDISERQAS